MKLVISTDNEETVNICDFYWAIDDDGNFLYTLKTISNKFNLSLQKINIMMKTYCIAYSSQIFCDLCARPYEYSSRAEYPCSLSGNTWSCSLCVENFKQETERNISQTLVDELTDKRENNPLTMDGLDIRTAVLLLALIRFGANEDLTYINEYNSIHHERLSPDPEFDIDYIIELYKTGYLSVSPLSNIEYMVLDKSNDSFSFDFMQVKWALPLAANATLKDFFSQLESKIKSLAYSKKPLAEVFNFCMEVMILECLNYLKYTMKLYKLPFSPGDKTKQVISKALESFSVGQVHNFILMATKKSVAFAVRTDGVHKKHAANTVVGNIERLVERAIHENWNVIVFNRVSDMPQSIISCVLFNTLLRTNDGGFHLSLPQIVESLLESFSSYN